MLPQPCCFHCMRDMMFFFSGAHASNIEEILMLVHRVTSTCCKGPNEAFGAQGCLDMFSGPPMFPPARILS